MLADVCVYLGRQNYYVSVVARGIDGLHQLRIRFGANGLRMNPIHVDYRDSNRFRALLEAAVYTYGYPDICISWIKSTAPLATSIAAEIANTGPGRCHYFDLRPSWTAAPDARPSQRPELFGKLKFVSYHEVVLGFILESHESRWLTNDDIASGVIEAVQRREKKFIVGTVFPWDKRPRRAGEQ
jgi:hypothetical protein